MKTKTKIKGLILASSLIIAPIFVACGDNAQQACASTIEVAKGGGSSGGSSGGGKSSSGGASSGAKSSGGNSSGGANSGKTGANTNSGNAGNGKQGSSGGGVNKTAQQAQASSNSKPTSKPDPASVKTAKDTAPATVTRGGSYTSTVTGNTYNYRSINVYRSPGYIWDIYDPYNPYNYWYMTTSPFYGGAYRYSNQCGGQQKQVQEDKNNINITIDNDGKVTKAEDKNPTDPDLAQPTDNDTVPATR